MCKMENEKICNQCHVSKPFDKFYKCKTGKYGLHGMCIECHNRKNREFHWSHREKDKERIKKWRENNLEKARRISTAYKETMMGKMNSWKRNAKTRSISWDITLSDLEKMSKTCFYTSLPLTMESGFPETISLDRIDSSKGYTSDNVVFCCSIINTMKLQLSVLEFVDFCGQIVSNKNRLQERYNAKEM